MLEKYLTYLNTFLLVVLLLMPSLKATGLLGATPPGTATTYGDVNVDTSIGTGGYYVNGVLVVSSSTANVSSGNFNTVNATTSITVNSGTPITRFVCGTTAFTIPALGRRTGGGVGIATTSITVANAKLGDMALISQNSTTDALTLQGIGNTASAASGTVTAGFFNPTDATTTAIVTSTVRACVISVQ